MSIKLILAFILFGLACYVLGRLSAGRARGGGGQMLQTSAPRTLDAARADAAHAGVLDAASLEEIKRLIREGQLIGAIKIYRDRMNCGLREAKDGVESIMKSL